MRALVAVALVLSTGCTKNGPRKVGTQPSWRKTEKPAPVVRSVTFAPTTEAVQRYNEPFQTPPKSPLNDAIAAAVRDAAAKAGTQTPVADARLFRACAELAEIVPEDGAVGFSLIEFALQRQGIIEPSPSLLVMWGDIESPEAIVEQLQPHIERYLADGATARFGIGTVKSSRDGSDAVVFSMQGSSVTTQPIPRALPAAGSFMLDAVVDARFKHPEVFVTREDGKTDLLKLELGHAGAFRAEVACGAHKGRQQVEITASDARGSTVLANFPVWCATTPPASVTIAPSIDDAPVATTEEAERRLLAMVNRDRGAQNLPPLAWDDRVAAVSRLHSAEMQRTKNVAHISPTTGSAADRVRAAGIKTAVVLENVARARILAEAHQGLMNSPGHRANIMSSSATHVGIGVVFGEESTGGLDIFVTQVFTRVQPKVDPARASDQVYAKLTAVKPVGNSPRLTGIAQQLADAMAAGKSREQAYALVKKQVDGLGAAYARVGSSVTAAAELESLDGASLLGDATKVDDVGIGIGQGTHAEIGDGAIWIVLLVAQKR